MDLVGALPTLQSEGSVASHNSAGRDSGTGDSMPSDAYHTVVPSLGEAGYPYNQVVFLPPLPTHTPSVSGYPVHHQQNMNEGWWLCIIHTQVFIEFALGLNSYSISQPCDYVMQLLIQDRPLTNVIVGFNLIQFQYLINQ